MQQSWYWRKGCTSISAEELQPETWVESSKCNDLYKLVGLIKEKLLVLSWNEKVKLLTLTPESWTIEKTMKEFQVSKYLVKKARSLKKELGILAEPKAKTGKVLMVAAPPNFREDLKISDQNNWGDLSKKLNFGGRELNFRGAYEPQWCHGCCVKRYSFMFVRF